MATTPIPNPTTASSISFPKIPFRIHSTTSFSSFSSSSRSRPARSIAVACSTSNNNVNGKASNSGRMHSGFGLKNLLSGFVDELVKTGDHVLMVEMLGKATQKLAEQASEIKKMKQTINQLQTCRAHSQIEKCREKLSEIKAVVEELERCIFKL